MFIENKFITQKLLLIKLKIVKQYSAPFLQLFGQNRGPYGHQNSLSKRYLLRPLELFCRIFGHMVTNQNLCLLTPGIPSRPLGGGGGHSAFLQKRLAKGQKYFDSGDYQMAQQKGRLGAGRVTVPVLVQPPTGEAHPTPDSVPGSGMYLYNIKVDFASGFLFVPVCTSTLHTTSEVPVPYFF